MALDRSGISVEGRTLLSSLKSRDFNITVRVLLTEPKLSVSEISRMTASNALEGTYCILPSRASLGTEVNVIADGFSSIPEGLNDYPSGHTILLLVTPDGGSEVCLMGASCDETIIADSRLHLLINLEETDGIFKPSVDFDSYVPQGIVNDMFSSMNDSLGQYVTVGTNQTVTGQKVFTGITKISSPLDADNVYFQLQTGGDLDTLSPFSSLRFVDIHRTMLGGIRFESSRNGTNQFLTSFVERYDSNYAFVSGVVDQKIVSNHYNVLVDDSCVFFGSTNEPPVGAWHEAARALSDYYAESSDIGRRQAATYSATDDYRERIRLRKVLYQEQIADTPAGTVKTYVDLYAQNITNVADTVKFQYTENETYTIKIWDSQFGDVVDTPVTGPVPHDLLTLSKEGGVYSTHFRGGYEIGNTAYSFGSAGSLSFETSITSGADDLHIPTSLAVKSYVASLGYISSYTETDPTVPSWAKQPTKPDYTAAEVGALPDDTVIPTVNDAVLTIKKNASDAGTSFTANASSDVVANLDLAEVALSGSYNDLSDTPTIPTVNDATLTIQKNGSTLGTFSANASSPVTVDIIVPTSVTDLLDIDSYALKTEIPTFVSELTNDAGYLTQHQDISGKADKSSVVASGSYDSQTHMIQLMNNVGTVLSYIDATDFIKDGMVDTVTVANGYLLITFNTDSGKEQIEIPITDIFDASNYYTKDEIDNAGYLVQQSLSDYALKSEIHDATLTIKKNSNDTGTTFTANSSTDVVVNLGLSTVATSGSYNDLLNKPTILSLDDVVTLTTDQDITGDKTFRGDLISDTGVVDADTDSYSQRTVTFSGGESLWKDVNASPCGGGQYVRESSSAILQEDGKLVIRPVSFKSYLSDDPTQGIEGAGGQVLIGDGSGAHISVICDESSSQIEVRAEELILPKGSEIRLLQESGYGFVTLPAYINSLVSLPTNLVTTDTTQTVTGDKTFTGSVTFDDDLILDDTVHSKNLVTVEDGVLSVVNSVNSVCSGLVHTTTGKVYTEYNNLVIPFPTVKASNQGSSTMSGSIMIGDSTVSGIRVSSFSGIAFYGSATFNNGVYLGPDDRIYVGSEDIRKYTLKRGIEFVLGTQASSTNAWTGTSTQPELYEGMMINYHLPYAGNSSAATLNLTLPDGSTTGAIPVRRLGNGTNTLTTQYPKNTVLPLVLLKNRAVVSGQTYTWVIADFSVNDTDTFNRTRVDSPVLAGENGIYGPTIIMRVGAGRYESLVLSSSTATNKTRNPHGFYLDEIYVYASSVTVQPDAGTSYGSVYTVSSVDVRYSINASSLLQYTPLYLVGTFTDGKFYLDSTWWSQTLPTAEDNKYYVFLGIMSSGTSLQLLSNHPIFYYKEGRLRQTSVAELDAIPALTDASYRYGQEYVLAEMEKPEGWPSSVSWSGTLFVTTQQDIINSLGQVEPYEGMCLNIWIPSDIVLGTLQVRSGNAVSVKPIFFRGNSRSSRHTPKIPAGSVLSVTWSNGGGVSGKDGWYADSYDIAHWKQRPEDFTKNFVCRTLPTDRTFTQTLHNTYGVFSGLNFLMMDTEGNWYPFLALDSAESPAPPISGKSFNVSQIVWNAESGYDYGGTGVFFSSHPKASIKRLMHYITWTRPCDLGRYDSQQNLYSDFDLYMRSCDSSRISDVRTLVTNILNGHISSGGTISGTVSACVDSIMTSVSQGRFPILICSKYREGAWEALRNGMYTFNVCGGYIEGVASEDKFAEFVQYKEGAPVWLNLQRNSAGGLYPRNLSFCPCFYADRDTFYDTDACVLVGFMTGVDNLNFIQDHPVYYNVGSNVDWDLRPYQVKEKLVDADIQGSFIGNISLPYGTCYTTKSTAAKIVNSLYGFYRSPIGFQDGDLVFVKFSNGNTSSSPTLDINGTGAVAVRTSPATYLGNVSEGDTLLLRYDTTYNSNNPSDSRSKTWYVVNSNGASTLYTARTVDGISFNGSANVTHYGTCSVAPDTVAKTVTVTGFVLETGARVTVKFSYSNTAQNPTLNVYNGSAYTGAKAIKYRGTSSVSDSSNYYRWQAGDIIDFIYDGTNWVMVGWQTYAYYAASATSASTASSATSATYLRYSTTNLLTAADTSTVTSAATIRPSSNGGSSLGSSNYKWNYVYTNYLGTSSYPVSTAYITDMQGTASKATSDASGNTITTTYLKSVTLVNSSGTDLTNSGTVGVNETGDYVVQNKWPVLLRLTKGSGTATDIGLRSLLCSYLMGIPRDNTSTSSSSSLGVNGAEGCIAILQVYRTSSSSTIPRGRLVSSYSTVSVHGISASGNSGTLEWTSGSEAVSGTWVALNHTTVSSGSYNYCLVLAIRIW